MQHRLQNTPPPATCTCSYEVWHMPEEIQGGVASENLGPVNYSETIGQKLSTTAQYKQIDTILGLPLKEDSSGSG